jgi:hypothetical protein
VEHCDNSRQIPLMFDKRSRPACPISLLNAAPAFRRRDEMKKAILTLAATAAALVSVSTAASAAPGQQPFGQRLAMLEQRINQGVRSGALTRSEADSLRVGVARIRLFEAQYRRGGINGFEQSDLNRRFENLARHVRTEKNDRDYRGDRNSRDDRGRNSYRNDRNSYADRGGYHRY